MAEVITVGMFDIYKQGQGKYTRMTTFLSGLGLTTLGAIWLSEKLDRLGVVYVQYGVSVVFWVGIAWLLFYLVNKPRMADFMIATEGEMKKVSWSSRREVIGSTKVVIFATFTMAVMLFVVDIAFKTFFQKIDVLQLSQ